MRSILDISETHLGGHFRDDGPAGKHKDFLHASSLLPQHELLGGRGQVQGCDDVCAVWQLQLHGLTGDALLLVYNQLPLPLAFALSAWMKMLIV